MSYRLLSVPTSVSALHIRKQTVAWKNLR